MRILKILIISFLIIFPLIALATRTNRICHQLEVPIGTMKEACGPADYLSVIYKIALGAGVFTAAVVIIYAGIVIAVSGDNVSKQKDARDQIFQAILGLLILFGSYLILRTINPTLTRLGEWQNIGGISISPVAEDYRPSAICKQIRKDWDNCRLSCDKLGSDSVAYRICNADCYRSYNKQKQANNCL